MENFYFRILDTAIKVSYNHNSRIRQYLEREYGILCCDEPSYYDISVFIHQSSFCLSSEAEKLCEHFFLDDGKVLQNFKAFRRQFWISYEYVKYLEIHLYISYVPRLIDRFLSPFYEDLDISCLADFFHNPFLYCVQSAALAKGASLIHCSAFSHAGKEKKVIAMVGCGQSGKSSIVRKMCELFSLKAYSEDFAIVNSHQKISGLLHQTRVKYKDFIKEDFHNSYGAGINMVPQKINKFIYNILKSGTNATHQSIMQYYSKAIEIPKQGFLGSVWYLERDAQDFEIKYIGPDEMTSRCLDVIATEFNNMINFKLLSEVLSKQYPCFFSYDNIIKNTEYAYQKCFSNLKCAIINLPKYDSIEETANVIYKVSQ